jgi:tRNA-specific 2-thiouridylase
MAASPETNENTVLVAMSGGVDSTAAVLLLQQAGYRCTGCTMTLLDGSGAAGDAQAAAGRLDIPFRELDLRRMFGETVVRDFAESYLRGRTPNPCVLCNRVMKFGRLLEEADALGCRYLATGHYARAVKCGDLFELRKAADPAKDQSYFLYTLTQERLARILFPLGEMRKEQVRELARAAGLDAAGKPESQDICFVPGGDYASVIERLSGTTSAPGDFIGPDGQVLGRHRGIVHYTVGQRRGLGIAWKCPLYVTAVDAERNTVSLGTDDALYRRALEADGVSWISGAAPSSDVSCRVRIRYRHAEQPARVIPTGHDTVRVEFEEPQRAVTPGQSAVFYGGDAVLGGGIIR